MMVISFQLDNVRNHLLEYGIVYTLRSKPHKEGLDWANSGRTTKKIADVNITEMGVNLLGLFNWLPIYTRHSGFKKTEQWIDAYQKLNHDLLMKKAILYKVELISTSSNKGETEK